MAQGTPATSLPAKGFLDYFIGNADSGVGMEGPFRVSKENVAIQLGTLAGLHATFIEITSRSLSSPPGSPTAYSRYIVASGASGDWEGYENYVATWNGSQWIFAEPSGAALVNDDSLPEYVLIGWDGSSWIVFSAYEDALAAGNAAEIAKQSALLALSSATNSATKTVLDFVAGENEYFAFDLTIDGESMNAAVRDLATPSNDYLGDAVEMLGKAVLFTDLKLITRKDGTLAYCEHNGVTYSGNANLWAYDGCSKTIGQIDPFGGTSAVLLTSSSTSSSYVGQTLGDYASAPSMTSFIVQLGDAVPYIEWSGASTRRAYFPSGAVGTVDAGLTASVHNTFEDGVSLLPSGWIRLTVYGEIASSAGLYLCLADSDGSTSVTSGKTLTVFRTQAIRGVRPLKYIETGAARVWSGVPYDWSIRNKAGERIKGALLETYRTRSRMKWGSDLTKSEWVKTNCNAAIVSDGPSGDKCSSLTATAANAKCVQTDNSVVYYNTFSAFVRAVTLTGRVWITADDGVTKKDISSLISYREFTRVWTSRTTTGDITADKCGFVIENSGDVLEVAFAHSSEQNRLGSPIATFGDAVTDRSPDNTTIPLVFNTSSTMSAYMDFSFTGDLKTNIDLETFIGDTPNDYYAGLIARRDHLTRMNFNTSNGSSNSFLSSDLIPPNGRIETALRIKENNIQCSAFMKGTVVSANPSFVPDYLWFSSGTGPLVIHRALVINRDIGDNYLRTWKQTREYDDPAYIDDIPIALEKQVPDTDRCREPGILIFSDDFYATTGFVTHLRRNVSGVINAEMPARIEAVPFTFDKVSKTLNISGDRMVLVEPSGWASNDGHTQSPCLIKQKYGTNAGRIHFFYGEVVSGVDYEVLKYTYSDDDMVTWSSPSTVVDPGSPNWILPGASGDIIELPPDDPNYPGRIIFPFYRNTVTKSGVIYLDPDSGNPPAVGGTIDDVSFSLYEPNISLRPNGQIIVGFREEVIGNTRVVAVSSDGGDTFSSPVAITGEFVNCSYGQSEGDIHGSGDRGITYVVGPTANTPIFRSKFTVKAFTGRLALTESGINYRPLGVFRPIGYSAVKAVIGDMLLIAYENSNGGNVNQASHIRLMAIKAPR